MMVDVGADRLFARWIVDGVDAESLPTLSFLISFFMALATGTSWGTMSILFPLILVPTYDASNGDATIFYATTAGILSGSVAGDHVSPISDTTVLSALACDCQLLAHVATQFGYVLVVVLISIIFGTVPIGNDAWPNIIGILLGALVIGLFVFFLCVPVISQNGKFDIITEIVMRSRKRRGREELAQIKEDTQAVYMGQDAGAKLTKTTPEDGEEEIPASDSNEEEGAGADEPHSEPMIDVDA
mmetsp:Transcript_12523/g.25935  ORF Transcript_12523/g.25935 Transcript_12523/m.25935 type:complete len:243 (-) Transcript_12523:220-948(-)